MPYFLLILTFFAIPAAAQNNSVFIRMNQVGFLQNDIKTAVIFSKKPFPDNKFFIVNKTGKIVYSGLFSDDAPGYDAFTFSSIIDFSPITEEGEYRLRIRGADDFKFKVNNSVYRPLVDSLLMFFRVQRCGPTDPLLHEPCHLSDATRVPGFSDNIVDVTGGWHDAGDYIKFLSTAAYTTYMLMFSYEFDKEKFGFDSNENSVPDVLEEARIGLDWLLRCRLKDSLLITQVQDLRDHDAGWRLPENDSLRFDRPGYAGIGKNIIGIYTAALSLGARIWSSKFYDNDFASLCLSTAIGTYSVRNNVPDLDKVHSGFYQDDSYYGKLALGAVELYLTTREESYLVEARELADSAGSDFWWSWGNMNSLAHYRLAKLGEDYSGYILNNILLFNSKMKSKLFGEATEYSWGTTNSLLGAALQVILYKDLHKTASFDSLAFFQRDYILGRNPWGLSFIYGFGYSYPHSLHSPVAYFNKGYLPGALSAGPAPVGILEKYEIKRQSKKYDFFNSAEVKYYDDYADYITNEPTITGNATAVFVYGYFTQKHM